MNTKSIALFVVLTICSIFLSGCKEPVVVVDPKQSPEEVVMITTTPPLPTEEMLNALGPLNNVDTRWLFSDPIFILAGNPARFLASPVGKGKEWLLTSVLQTVLSTPIQSDEVERFVQSSAIPLSGIIEVDQNGKKVPERYLVSRRATILTFKNPITPKSFFERLNLDADQIANLPKIKVGEIEYYDMTPPNFGIPVKAAAHFPDERTLVMVEGDDASIKDVFDGKPPHNAVVSRFQHTDCDNADLVLVASREGIATDPSFARAMLQQFPLPPELLLGISKNYLAVMATLNTSTEIEKPMLRVLFESNDAKGAAELAELVQGMVVFNQTSLATLNEQAKAALQFAPEFAQAALNAVTVEAKDNKVELILNKFADFDKIADVGLMDAQAAMQNRIAQQAQMSLISRLGVAFFAYCEKNKKFPNNILAADGTPLLSWRVALLPQIGREDLYKKFKLDEPWDGPTNKPLLDSMPPIFSSQNPGVDKTKSVYRFFNSEGTPFANPELKLEDLKNPQSTLLLAAVKPSQAVEWTRPEDLKLDVMKLEDVLGNLLFGISFGKQFLALPIIPIGNPQAVQQRPFLEAVIRGLPLPQPSAPSGQPSSTENPMAKPEKQ